MRRNSITLFCEQCAGVIPNPRRLSHGKPKKFCSPTCHMANRQSDIATRLTKYVNKTETCWLWIGALSGAGYGHFNVNRKLIKAHRASWEIHRGSIPEGLMVLHNCPGGDNRACLNPDHLWLGTNADNMRDMVAKRRLRRAA